MTNSRPVAIKQRQAVQQLELLHNSTWHFWLPRESSRRSGEQQQQQASEAANFKKPAMRVNSKQNMLVMGRTTSRPLVSTSLLPLLLQVVAFCLLASQLIRATESAESTSAALIATDQLIRQAFPHRPLSQEGLAFDGAQHKSIYEAIRAHPDLREFASLCEAKGVREIVSMDKIALTVFAPIDKSLGDLLAKSRERNSINLIELAKHHIAQGLVMPDDNMKYPFQLQSYALLSPLYLSQATTQHPPTSATSGVYVNNAKILASYLIPVDADNFQTLHLIDEPLEFAFAQRLAQVRHQAGGSRGSSAQSGSSAGGQSRKQVVTRKPFTLDELLGASESGEPEPSIAGVLDYADRFGDLSSGQPQAELFRERSQWSHLSQSQRRKQLDFNQAARRLGAMLASAERPASELRQRWTRLNESHSLNTYFLPVSSHELDQLLHESASLQEAELVLQAHVIPDQVLFTRPMGLGTLHGTMLNQLGNKPEVHHHQTVSLSLAKQLPASVNLNDLLTRAGATGEVPSAEAELELARRLASSPLMLQAKCAPSGGDSGEHEASFMKNGLTQAEILLANIPLANGVLHLISKPILRQPTSNLLNYINDNDHQLSTFVQSLGSQSGPLVAASQPIELNRFRELLVRDRTLLATFSNDLLHSNRTLLAPTDEAFSRLRFELRALVTGDEQLVPSHWDPSYRADRLERLIKRHIIPDTTLISDRLRTPTSGYPLAPVSALNGQQLSFREEDSSASNLQVVCDATSGRILHRDLIGSNGVLHVIDRVLGEELETVNSLMRSLVLRYQAKLSAPEAGLPAAMTPLEELTQLVERQLGSAQQDAIGQQLASAGTSTEYSTAGNENPSSVNDNQAAGESAHKSKLAASPELTIISKTVGHYLDELSRPRRELLASSVNISFQLARLVSRAELRVDWNEQFTTESRRFTYFVPNDLAWLQLCAHQPELYKPLVYFLASGEQAAAAAQQLVSPGPPSSSPTQQAEQQQVAQYTATGSLPRSSESSHRLLQILERHLIASGALTARELNQLPSIQTVGATLRLVDAAQANQLTLASSSVDGTTATSGGQNSAFAALHAIIGGGGGGPHATGSEQLNQQAAGITKALKLGATQANILRAYETSNGNLYLIDNVLILPEDADYIVQTSSTPAISSTMSSLLGGHNSALLDFVRSLFSANTLASANTMITLIGSLLVAIVVLALVALVLVVRKRSQNKSLNRHQHLESGLTSSSSANSGSTSTTKSL